jgi:Ca2+:H+ antiporter
VVGLVMPALFAVAHPAAAPETALRLSEGVAVVLGLTYVASLVFSLVTHHQLFRGDTGGGGGGHSSAPSTPPAPSPPYGTGVAVGILCGAAALVAVESEILVHATEAVVARVGVSELFLGLIVIPLIGNAAEHATAIVVARRGQTDLALHIALGSSTQIALFVAPVLVGVGALLGRPMNLVFTSFEVITLGLSSLIVTVIALDGESHWFEGIQLLAVYALIAIAVWFI